ncbi:ABC transporter ATP-binding protein [Hoyosella sp. YIM 151337]|uniref:ABC transporter ATP-binding protein n=1 Tax=Hoyosella sp. YIM 151337 TaxID=2992742 RepID=UPI002235A40C|nr:ABC transporter ATP-binding protein [Hoyosella sp. YIM 151337]MCW4355090.1 ABC transporter ATP-binding protein [Hoyosella sp. YIM 151337]
MLVLDSVTVRYGEHLAVDDANLRFSAGSSVVALLGPSGSGKSTVLRAIAGLEPLLTGRITFAGTDISEVPVHRRNIGLVFQDGQLFPHRTVAGNVAYGLTIRRPGQNSVLPRDARDARVAELLALVGLHGYENRRVDQLSGGEAQRVALARALAPHPRLLLLDEPLSALDKGLRERLAMDIRRIVADSGTPALVVTHDQSEAAFLADEIAVIIDGRIRQIAPPRKLWSAPADRAVASFLGYTSIVPAEVEHGVARSALGATSVDVPDGPAELALSADSLVVARHGPITGVVTSLAVLPDGLRLRVVIDGHGEFAARGAVHDEVLVGGIGEVVRLGLDGRRTGVIRPVQADSHVR